MRFAVLWKVARGFELLTFRNDKANSLLDFAFEVSRRGKPYEIMMGSIRAELMGGQKMPDLCLDLSFWKAGGGRTLNWSDTEEDRGLMKFEETEESE